MNIGKSTADLFLPAETAAECDQAINPLIILMREEKVDEAAAQIALIDDDTVHTIGRRVCERWVNNIQSGIAVGALAILASESTGQTIVQNHASERELLAILENMFMADYSRRSLERRAAYAASAITPTQS
jgi:hypothetical protein